MKKKSQVLVCSFFISPALLCTVVKKSEPFDSRFTWGCLYATPLLLLLLLLLALPALLYITGTAKVVILQAMCSCVW